MRWRRSHRRLVWRMFRCGAGAQEAIAFIPLDVGWRQSLQSELLAPRVSQTRCNLPWSRPSDPPAGPRPDGALNPLAEAVRLPRLMIAAAPWPALLSGGAG